MKVGVAAASGRLGSAVLQELLQRLPAEDVVAVARDPGRVDVAGVTLRPGDYTDPTAMREAFSGIDVVILISAPVAGGGDRLAMHRQAIEAAAAAGVSKLIYTSVIGNELAVGTYFEPFYRVNCETEACLRESGLTWVIARNGLYLDLDVAHIRRADSHGGVYSNNAGAGRCGYASIAELGYALAQLALSDSCDGMAVNLFGELYTQAELVGFVNAVYRLNVRYEPVSLEDNVNRLLQDEQIAARGEDVARMLSGCFQCIDRGAYEVMSHFRRAAGRDAKSIPEQLAELA